DRINLELTKVVNIDNVESIIEEILTLKRSCNQLEGDLDQLIKLFDNLLKYVECNAFMGDYDFYVTNSKILESNKRLASDFISQRTVDHSSSDFLDIIIKMLKQRGNSEVAHSLEKSRDFSKIVDHFNKVAYDELYDEAQKEFSRKKLFTVDFGNKVVKYNYDGYLRYNSEDALGPEMFDLKLMKCNESAFTEIITPDLLSMLNKKIEEAEWIQKVEMIPASVIREVYNPNLKPLAPKMELYVPQKVAHSKEEIDTAVSPESHNAKVTHVSDLEKQLQELNAPKKKSLVKPFKFTEKKEIVLDAVKPQSESVLKIRYHKPASGSSYWDWFNGLTQEQSIIVKAHLNHLTERQKGVKSLKDGLYELKIHQYKGLRIYFKYTGSDATVLLGGDKKSQSSDIAKAKAMALTIK
ncbi:MAG: hypothetical protein JHC93_08490, partial [Parachlamydiales bacterium]|nr:hypothetical protein [Parachlamydiales bacterium]